MYASFPSSMFCDITPVAGNKPRWEYLCEHYRLGLFLAVVEAGSWLLSISWHSPGHCSSWASGRNKARVSALPPYPTPSLPPAPLPACSTLPSGKMQARKQENQNAFFHSRHGPVFSAASLGLPAEPQVLATLQPEILASDPATSGLLSMDKCMSSPHREEFRKSP